MAWERLIGYKQTLAKFVNNSGNQKLKAWSFQLRKNCLCMLNIERPIARQSSITFFFIHPVYVYYTGCLKKGIGVWLDIAEKLRLLPQSYLNCI